MPERPLPVRNELNAHYWDGAQQEKLVILRCPECGTYIHPPRESCWRCRHEKLDPTEMRGRGTVYSWSVMHSGGNPGFEDKIPYTVLVVELDEQPNLITIGNLVDGDSSELTIGAPLQVCFEKVTDEITLPQWRLVR